MKSKINLELKYFCKDFMPIRKVLRNLGARKIIVKKQKDYFFNLPTSKDKKITPRLKFRVDDTYALIFYKRKSFSSKGNTPSKVSIQFFKEANLVSFLDKALGIRTIVEKQRELWKKGNTVFHLDTVKGVGKIFEIEVWATNQTIKTDRLKFKKYRKLVSSYLDKMVRGSNEDLVSRRH